MRTRNAVTALAAAALVAAAATGATPAPASSSRGCTPTWKLVSTPSTNPALAGNGATLWGASVAPGKDAWFPGTAEGGSAGLQPWVLHWNGRSLGVAGAVPQGPFTQRDAKDGGSFDSATDGWVLGTSYLLPVAYPQYAAHWSGRRWTITPLAVSPHPTDGRIHQLSRVASLSPSDAWAVGNFNYVFSVLGTLIEHWDGTKWSIVPSPLSSQPGAALSAITAVSATDIWAVGQQPNADSVTVPLVEHWNGTSWRVVPVPVGAAPSSLSAVSADGPNDIWAVGQQLEPGTSSAATGLVEHWNGTTWSVVTSLPNLGNSELTSVYAARSTDVWATVFTVLPDTDLGVDNFLHWNGSSWTLVPVPGLHEYATDYEYRQLAGSGPDDIWAAGEIEHPSTASPLDGAPLLAHLSCG
jgi:hypothetical protein